MRISAIVWLPWTLKWNLDCTFENAHRWYNAFFELQYFKLLCWYRDDDTTLPVSDAQLAHSSVLQNPLGTPG